MEKRMARIHRQDDVFMLIGIALLIAAVVAAVIVLSIAGTGAVRIT